MIKKRSYERYFFENDPSKGGRPRKLDPVKALKLRLEGYSYPAIGRKLGVDHSTVISALKNFKNLFQTLPDAEIYERIKPPCLSALELKLVNALANDEKIDKANYGHIAFAIREIAKLNNLARGKPTEIQDITQVEKTFKEIKEEKEELLKEIKKLGGIVIDGELVEK
ncbi:MAG: hypothetical protein AB1397_02970 [bacterium]